jgi:nucleotide-binding universal stress UspA family protein
VTVAERSAAAAPVQVRRILVPLDLSPLGEAKLPFAESLARTYGAELILFHVLRRATPDDEGVSPEEERAGAYLETVAAPLHNAGLPVHGIVRVASDIATAIVDEAREQRADLIVLGADVRRGLNRALRGSVSDEVSRRAHCPVLLVQPDVEAGAGSPIRSFDADAKRRGPLARWTLGLRTVEVARVVGSVGRAAELDTSFRTSNRSPEERQRYQRVLQGVRGDGSLPPIVLYKLGAAYYVLDGNHRLAAAKQLGQLEIEAEVTEFVPLGDAEAQRIFAKRRRFEAATGLTRIAAAHRSETYPRLAGMVRRFAVASGLNDSRQAARRWYEQVYRPLEQGIRARGLPRRFPGAHVADVVAMVDAFREPVEAGSKRKLEWDELLDLFAECRATVA